MNSRRRAAGAPPVKVRIYRMRNRLKEKAIGLGGEGGGEIPEELLAKAQAEFEKLAEDYPDWVQKHLDELYGIIAEAEADDRRRPVLYKQIQELAHELKGQGGTFGYPLISRFGDSLYGFTGPNSGRTDNHMKIIKAHVDAMQATIKGRVAGDGGPIGTELTKILHAAIEKYGSRP